ncbi:MAG: tetratricopeptide repeat protein, partial [Chitinivibrionales bacterium]|nr:tetratricopeptide repeat protein [Chitinivibrionales bacterium]
MKIISLLILLSFFAVSLRADDVYRKNRKANKLYKEGKYEEALRLYEDALLEAPGNPALKMNRGSASYKLKKFDQAEEDYMSALSQEDVEARADLHYNLGNILYRQGQQLMQRGQPQASEKFKLALENYIKTLDIDPNDQDAKWNLQLTQEMIKQLEKQQQKDQNKQDKNKDQDKQNKQNKQDQKNKNKDDKKEQQDQKNKQQEKQDQQKEQQQQQDKKEQQPPPPSP